MNDLPGERAEERPACARSITAAACAALALRRCSPGSRSKSEFRIDPQRPSSTATLGHSAVPRSTLSPIRTRGQNQLRQPINGILVEDELIAEAMRPCLDLASCHPREDIAQLRGGSQPVGMRCRQSAPWLRSPGNLGFKRAY